MRRSDCNLSLNITNFDNILPFQNLLCSSKFLHISLEYLFSSNLLHFAKMYFQKENGRTYLGRHVAGDDNGRMNIKQTNQ